MIGAGDELDPVLVGDDQPALEMHLGRRRGDSLAIGTAGEKHGKAVSPFHPDSSLGPPAHVVVQRPIRIDSLFGGMVAHR